MAETLLSARSRFDNLPENYIRPESERPHLSKVVSLQLPLIDLNISNNRDELIRQIGHACRNFGFFQVTNRGVSMESTEKVFARAREFFHMPVELKTRYYSDDPSKKMRLSTTFNVTNHGISMETTEKVFARARPGILSYAGGGKDEILLGCPSKKMRLSTSFNVKNETVHNWRDYLRLHCYPLEEFVNEWPETPQSFK